MEELLANGCHNGSDAVPRSFEASAPRCDATITPLVAIWSTFQGWTRCDTRDYAVEIVHQAMWWAAWVR